MLHFPPVLVISPLPAPAPQIGKLKILQITRSLHEVRRLRKKLGFVCLLTFSTTLLSGCSSPVSRILDQFDEAIDQFKQLRKQIGEDSLHIQRNVLALIDKLDGKVRDAVNDGTLGRAAADFIGPPIDGVKGLGVMLETRMLAYLGGVIEALEIKRNEVKRAGVIPPDTAETIIARVIASVKEIEPFVDIINSKSMEYQQNGKSRILQAKYDVDFGGFGFKNRQFQLMGLTNEGKQVWTAPAAALTANTDFRITFVAQKATALPNSVEKLALIWTENPAVELASILLKPGLAIVPEPKLSEVMLSFRSKHVKYPTVAFNVDLTILNGPKLTLPLMPTCGRGDIREEHTYFSYTTPMDVATKLDENSTVIIDLAMNSSLGGPVTHTYTQSSPGYPQTFTSGTHQPKFATLEQIQRFGFSQRGLSPSHTKWDLREPLRMVAADWSGYVRMSVVHGGKVTQFDECNLLSFKKGCPKSGKLALRLAWKGNGILMPHDE